MCNKYRHVEMYLTELAGDIYEQPLVDDNHKKWTEDVLTRFLSTYVVQPEERTVLDVGCGQGVAQPVFESFGWMWKGVTLGKDYVACRDRGLNVDCADFTFLPYADDSFYMVYARHSAEHSPMPLLTLMEWHRVAKQVLILIVPIPKLPAIHVIIEKDASGNERRQHVAGKTDIGEVLGGLNHYSLLTQEQWEALLGRAGWIVVGEDTSEPKEVRLYCHKYQRPHPPATSATLHEKLAEEWSR